MSAPSIDKDKDGYFDLGTFSHKIITPYYQAQTWFDRGLIWSYGFNHEEAVSCFEKAIAADPSSPMPYWGLAYALGPNYNKPWDVFDPAELKSNLTKAHHAANKAWQLSADGRRCTEIQHALVSAMGYRYPSENPADDRSQWNLDYAQAMAKVYEETSSAADDLDVAALYADALMNLTPWSLWDIRTGKPADGAATLKVKTVLEKALAQPGGLKHPGILHLYIHLMEMSGTPEKALTAADALRSLVPDAGHLNHMPSHIDILCGEYRQAMRSNLEAMDADDRYFARAGNAPRFYTLYRCHDFHFRIYAAMFAGNYAAAIETVERLEAALPEELLRVESPPMADWLEAFLAIRVHVLVRFGKWEELLALQFPADATLCCMTTAMLHYGQGVAHAVLGRVQEASTSHDLLQHAIAKVPQSRTLFNNTCQDILAVASSMLRGELAYRRGVYGFAFEELRFAVHQSDALPYDEPWGWMQPPRHALGALLLEQGYFKEAAAEFSADLGYDDVLPRALQHPNNIWALRGYHECLTRLDRHDEARIVRKQLDLCAASADVPIEKSCFCAVKRG